MSMGVPKFDFIVGPAILVYFAILITELTSSVPIGLVQNDYGGKCILSAKVTVFKSNSSIKVNEFGSKVMCEFCTYLSIITTIFPLLYGGYSLYALCQTLENATQMWVLPALMFNFVLMILKLISSCILSVGISQLCSSVVQSGDIKSCDVGQKKTWYSGANAALNGDNYYTYLTTAQTASWISVLEWVAVLVLTILHYRRNILLRSAGSSVPVDVTSDTAGVIRNEVPPATSTFNPVA